MYIEDLRTHNYKLMTLLDRKAETTSLQNRGVHGFDRLRGYGLVVAEVAYIRNFEARGDKWVDPISTSSPTDLFLQVLAEPT